MKELIVDNLRALIFIFVITLVSYYLLTTKGSFVIPHDLDYFNPLAKAFLSGRLDLYPKPVVVSDLSVFNGKWYPYWGPLPALLLIPSQLVLHRYVPAAYLSMLFAGLNMCLAYLIFTRMRKEYFTAALSVATRLFLVVFLAFGTSHLFIATRSGTWFVAQTVSFLPIAIALFILVKKKLSPKDYFLASCFISLTLIGRYNLIAAMIFLALRILDDTIFNKESFLRIKTKIVVSVVPFLVFLGIFCLYNFVRFGNPFDFGFAYTVFDYYNFASIKTYGMYSLHYVPMNLWRFFIELPQLTIKDNFPQLVFNQLGISIFAASPLFIAAINTINKSLFSFRSFVSRIQVYLWVLVLVQIALLSPFFTTGFNQMGLRYATDFALPLTCLAVFGLRGKLNTLAILAIMVAVAMNIYGLFVI